LIVFQTRPAPKLIKRKGKKECRSSQKKRYNNIGNESEN